MAGSLLGAFHVSSCLIITETLGRMFCWSVYLLGEDSTTPVRLSNLTVVTVPVSVGAGCP